MQLTNIGNKNITSLELLNQINFFRKKEGDRAELQHRDLKNRFGVASYRDIKRKDLGDTLEYISTWIEPAELRSA